jgi:hypothetical protein
MINKILLCAYSQSPRRLQTRLAALKQCIVNVASLERIYLAPNFLKTQKTIFNKPYSEIKKADKKSAFLYAVNAANAASRMASTAPTPAILRYCGAPDCPDLAQSP